MSLGPSAELPVAAVQPAGASPTPELSVVIPAYNERRRIAPTLAAVVAYLDRRRLAYEVLVVDDGSADGTAELVAACGAPRVVLLRLPANRGKGAALKAGVLASRGDRVLLSDADLSTPIDELEKLETRLASVPVVLGSRAVAGAEITLRQPRYRELMGKTFNKIIRLAGVARGIRDTQCGFKLLRGDVARRLFAALITPGFAYDVELVWLARRSGLAVVEVGVRWADSPSTRVHPLVDPCRMLRDIARFRWRHRRFGREFPT